MKKIDWLTVRDWSLSFIFSIIVVSTIYGVYLYFQIPNNANISFPGDLIPVNELIEEPTETNLFAVTVQSVMIKERKQFLTFMWQEKRPILRYTYRAYEDTEKLHESAIDEFEHILDKESAAIDSIIDFSFDHFDENVEEVDEFLEPLSWYSDVYGDSMTLLIMVYLIGLHEDKPWIQSNQKIAMTASLDDAENVLPVGAVPLKAISAKREKADVLIVPKEQLDEVYKGISQWSKLTVIGVETIDETIEWLDENVH